MYREIIYDIFHYTESYDNLFCERSSQQKTEAGYQQQTGTPPMSPSCTRERVVHVNLILHCSWFFACYFDV